MRIIRDEEYGGIMMIPLLTDWNVYRCNVLSCKEQPNTIVCNIAEDIPLCGFCEKHHQEAKEAGKASFTLEFDDFNAFAE